jgi:SAM-dependent methyltransferase
MDYNSTFTKRCHSYAYALQTYPNALQYEFQTAVEELNMESDDILLNIPAACVSLSSYYTTQPRIVYEYETNTDFAALTNTPICSFFDIPLPDQSVSKIVSLASLHHTNLEERPLFYKECKRILKPGGKLLIGDVQKYSNQAYWLNEFVDRHNPQGHKGTFWDENDCPLLQQAGFTTQLVERNYPWTFSSKEDMVDFSKHLFGLETDSETIYQGLEEYLTVFHTKNSVGFPWKLIYIHARLDPQRS